MKKSLSLICVLVLGFASIEITAQAGDLEIGPDAPRPAEQFIPGLVNKATRGGINLVTGIVEWPVQTYKGYKNGVGFIENEVGSKTVGTLMGLFLRGPGHAAGRMASGGKDLFGCWTANRPDNAGIGVPLDAEYAWEMGEQYSIFKPTLKEGVMPIPRKLVHGLANGFAGIAELPGQIVQGAHEGKTARGVVDGFWFFLSRNYNGFADIFLCVVPNPEETVGYPWDEEWPWDALLGR